MRKMMKFDEIKTQVEIFNNFGSDNDNIINIQQYQY